MADKPTAVDILGEAMEYLSKLGMKLRSRSDSMKEKKIKQNKLRNSHAVKKTANKVLLLCELSKKSLNIVETTVKNILTAVGSEQAVLTDGDGGNSRHRSSTDSEHKAYYFYFNYGSRKLKLKKKVSIKHFTSVKVLAKKMSKSTMKKYPVYYDSKLKRYRKAKELKNKSPEKQMRRQSAESGDSSAVESCDIQEPKKDTLNAQKKSVPKKRVLQTDSEDESANETSKSKDKASDVRSKIDSEKKLKRPIIESSDSSAEEKNNVKNISLDESEISSSKMEDKAKSETETTKKTNKENKVSSKDKDLSENRPVETKNLDENDDVSQKDIIETSKLIESLKSCTDANSGSASNFVDVEMPLDSKKSDTVSSEDKEKSSEKSKKEKSKKTQVESESKNEVITLDDDEHDDKSLNSDEESKKTEGPVLGKKIKPVIKCVNLSKLLKPTVLQVVGSQMVETARKNSEKTKSDLNKSKNNTPKRVRYADEEEFWAPIRKQVAAFKAKKFTINISRLPEWSNKFLDQYNIKKVTKDGATIYERTKLSAESNKDLFNEPIDLDFTNRDIEPDILTVKNALLNDSDSDLSVTNNKPCPKSRKNNSGKKKQEKTKHKCSKSKSKRVSIDSSDEQDSKDSDKVSQNGNEKMIVSDDEKDESNSRVISKNIENKSENSEEEKSENSDKDKSKCNDDDISMQSEDDRSKKNEEKSKHSKENKSKNRDEEKSKNNDEEKSKKSDNEKSKSSEDDQSKHSDLEGSKQCDEKKSKHSSEEKSKKRHKDRLKRSEDKSKSSDEEQSKKSDDDKSMSSDEQPKKSEDDKSKSSDEEQSKKSDEDKSMSSDEQPKKSDEDKSRNSADDQSKHSDDDKSKHSDDGRSKKKENSNIGEENSKQKNENSKSSDKGVTKDDVDSEDKESIIKEKTPERNIQNDKNKNESCIILSSTEKTKNSDDTPTKSRRKHIMESMKAKKMLLTYSSSDTEDEKLNAVLKEIKGSLLKEGSSDEEKKKKDSSSDSDVGKFKKDTKKRKHKSSSSSDEFKKKHKKHKKSSKRKSESRHKETSSKKMGRTTDKTGGSSSQSSDTQDDKHIDRLTSMKSLSKSRRRRGSSSTDEKVTRSSSRKKVTIAPLMTGEGLLEAPESSDNSDPESDTVEELPPISLTGLNGGGEGLTHLAKDDLLGDSDSASSNDNDKDDEDKNDEESGDEKNVKSKRRKANTISSDSDNAPKKDDDKDVKMSDFEDSEDDSEPNKRKRKKKAPDSDASGSGTDGGKKKRRRIKQINDSDGSESDSENEGKKHGRKNIRKVMGKNQLEEATKKAAREEKERIARIAERQKLYNNLDFDETGKPDEVIPDKLVLDFDVETKEPTIEVDKGLVKKLKPHQANGIRFMWNACFESVKRIKKDRGSGCILAHCMGLGKTLQVVALTHTLLTHSELTKVNRVLVVCPLSTVLNWVNEFNMWLKHAHKENEIDVYELSRFKQNSERAYQLSQWLKHGGVCVLGYEMFRNLSADNPKKYKKKMLKHFQEALVDPGPDLVVCDEGHLLKNEKTSLSQSMNRVRTLRRIVLTGTPLQNNLKEYYCMVQFVKPNLLGKYNEYLNRFVNPITNGQYTDSTEHDIKIMKRRSHVLHKMLDGSVQRRDYSVLAPFLPPKHEYVLFITLSEVQIKLYQNYLDNYSRRPLPGKSSGFLFPDFQSLQRIWTHPLVLKYNSERYEIMQQKKREREEEDSEGSLVDFIDDDSTPDESSTDESSDDLSDLSDDSRKKSKKKKSAKKSKGKDKPRRGTRANPVELEDEEVKDKDNDVIEVKNDNPTEWWIPLVTDDELEDIRHSHKLMLLFDILRQSEAIGDKLLVFSQSLYSLDLIEHFLGKVDEATQEGRIDEKLGGHVGSWSPGVDYFRLDGSTSCENRSIWCKNFNREDNPRARLFLISTRAGGLGINLVAANRVIIFDVSWNPSHDVQSIFRVYRFGQKKPCYIYRFLAMGTMEEKIYERQVTKQAISKRVIDEQQIDRHYKENDLAELYKFEPRPPVPRPLPPVPKDRMFAELLKVHDALVYKFHEHDSLLENKEEETLSEEERKAAWEDFENEKNRPPPAPYPTAWPMNNGMMNNLLAQQQQQLAYAALATMLRKDMPNLSDDQLRNMLPLIYGANPGLMQKLSDIYKYPGAGMMNPILNSVMNSGSGGAGLPAGAGGGSSGLQYEPPWAREQQQQQQIRLQQLMQQQNSMGAKMYAGGLGSRDPVAMALQQQRAREMMMQQAAAGAPTATAAARQRGRPPHVPRPGPATDVVTLDSD